MRAAVPHLFDLLTGAGVLTAAGAAAHYLSFNVGAVWVRAWWLVAIFFTLLAGVALAGVALAGAWVIGVSLYHLVRLVRLVRSAGRSAGDRAAG